ncbi:(Fe-S)-binding protein [Raoultibacter phocaeensis]|uniref:(Fe-S)-binding protein n=1 Tax=Raoultibacter phocaeensis TaxID=2479841 RepID=UPI00111830D6|nr:(Fe-S)-binding protein [Raoultibacter phocaeensis]
MGRVVYEDALTNSAIALDGYAYELLGRADRKHGHGARSVFFPGCSVINFAQPLMSKVYEMLTDLGEVDGISLLCCGKLLSFEPDADVLCPAFRSEFSRSVAEAGVRRIVTACPNCTAEVRRMLSFDPAVSDVEVIVLPEVLAAHGIALEPERVRTFFERNGIAYAGDAPTLAVHDSCPDRTIGEFARGVRSLIAGDLLVEMEHNRASSLCCGSLAKAAGKPDAATRQAKRRGEEGKSAGADGLVTVCMSCSSQLSSFQDTLPVMHYLELLCDERIDWDGLPPYLQMRFLFEARSGRRDYDGLSGGACCGASAVPDADCAQTSPGANSAPTDEGSADERA